MRRTIFLAVLLALGSLGLCGQARADQLTLTSVASNTYQGYFIGPYTVQVSGGGTLLVICDDFNTDVSQGLVWNATGVTFSDPTFLKDVKFGNVPNALTDYFAAAYLAQEIIANLSNTTKVDELSFALWGIFSAGAYSQMDWQSRIYYNQAFKNASTGNYSNIEFLVPSPTGSSQEYITILATPEPSKWVLLLCGALLLVVIKIKHLLV